MSANDIWLLDLTDASKAPMTSLEVCHERLTLGDLKFVGKPECCCHFAVNEPQPHVEMSANDIWLLDLTDASKAPMTIDMRRGRCTRGTLEASGCCPPLARVPLADKPLGNRRW
jgi:hypothetical protein